MTTLQVGSNDSRRSTPVEAVADSPRPTSAFSRTPIDSDWLENKQLSRVLVAWDTDVAVGGGRYVAEGWLNGTLPRAITRLVGDAATAHFRVRSTCTAALDYSLKAISRASSEFLWRIVEKDRHLEIYYQDTRDVVDVVDAVLGVVSSMHTDKWLPPRTRDAQSLELSQRAPERTSGAAQNIVEVVDWIVQVTGLSTWEVCKAAGLSERTFYYWKDHPESRPRLSSQGGLWRLAQSIEELLQDVDEPLDLWLTADPDRKALLIGGRHTELINAVLESLALQGRFDDPITRRRHAGQAVAPDLPVNPDSQSRVGEECD